ncbi:MAG: hypothetical protein A2Y38_16830 [Spirochaetes bacterium GWB1_59_5]|nr:MAG: hypothetical protein A2Y38_16830 [Spirochaetes bacterium GWB1_59_5]
MPKLQDIDQFKASLKTLGRETEVLQHWGETWHDLEAPPQGMPEDLASLLEIEAEEPTPVAEFNTPSDDQDFASFLDDMSLGESGSKDETPPDDFELPGAFQETDNEPAEDEFSVPASLLEGLESFADEDTELPETEKQFEEADEEEAPAEIAEIPETVENLEAFDEPDGFDDLKPATDSMPEMEPEPEASFGTDPSDTFGLDDLGSFAEEPKSADAAVPDEFSIPGFDDMASTPPLAKAIEESPEEPSFDLGSESMDGDAFDQFDLGGPSQHTMLPELSSDDFAKGLGQDDIEAQIASLDGEASTADNFSLDAGWGGDFTIPGFEMGGETTAPAAPKPSKGARPAQEGQLTGAFGVVPVRPQVEKKVKPVEFTDEQADALQDTLLSYPLNLRLAVEDIVANNKGSEAQQSELLWMLVEGASAKDAAKLAGRVLKRYIEVPASFAKRTGAAFEADKGSFRYIFVHSILPVLQILILVAAGAGAIFYLGYSFAYKPLKANSLYAEGLRQLELTKYGESMEFFDRADIIWSMKRWHYRYAENFAKSGQYPRAESMYDRLLASWPRETQAALDYAGMEREQLAFPKAESVLQNYILGSDYFNKKALLMSAENFLAWADFEEQQYRGPDLAAVDKLYENARLQLATLMERHGRSDAYLELMLLYFLRTERFSKKDNIKEILPLATYFMGNAKSGWSASTLAELGEYLLDRDETGYVNTILLAGVDKDGELPEVHVALARWNRRSGFPADELLAMEYAARFYAESDARTGLSSKRNKRYIESLIRLGELRREDGRSLDAEDAFNTAIDRYERALDGRQFKRDAAYGKAYALLADIYYAERMDFKGALSLYSEAEKNGFITPETDYRRGYIHYMQPVDDGSSSLDLFYRAALDTDPSPYLQWATANALFARDDFFAAQGYYSMLANRLQFELDTIALPSPQTKPSHNEIVELLMMARNNLGVTLFRVSERMGDAKRRAEAMVQFTESARLFDSLARDQRTMLRSESRNLGFLNLDFVLHPLRGIDLGSYRIIPTELAYPRQ